MQESHHGVLRTLSPLTHPPTNHELNAPLLPRFLFRKVQSRRYSFGRRLKRSEAVLAVTKVKHTKPLAAFSLPRFRARTPRTSSPSQLPPFSFRCQRRACFLCGGGVCGPGQRPAALCAFTSSHVRTQRPSLKRRRVVERVQEGPRRLGEKSSALLLT
jgi:hypothetical protein